MEVLNAEAEALCLGLEAVNTSLLHSTFKTYGHV